MIFYKVPKTGNESGSKKYAVYMNNSGNEHYVCDIIDNTAEKDIAANELGLTLRTRLLRSKGAYAMLEGTIFNPERLLDAVCDVTDFKKESFTDGDYKKGYTLLTITADGCVNKYMIFSNRLLDSLLSKIKYMSKSK